MKTSFDGEEDGSPERWWFGHQLRKLVEEGTVSEHAVWEVMGEALGSGLSADEVDAAMEQLVLLGLEITDEDGEAYVRPRGGDGAREEPYAR